MVFVCAFRRRHKLDDRLDKKDWNWESLVVSSNDSPYLQVMASSEKGVVFKNKRDRKLIVPDPNVLPLLLFLLSVFLHKHARAHKNTQLSNEDPDLGDKTANRCTRVEILTPEYVQVVLYDHMTRRKTTS